MQPSEFLKHAEGKLFTPSLSTKFQPYKVPIIPLNRFCAASFKHFALHQPAFDGFSADKSDMGHPT
jgi:hypothetical protein